MSLFIGISLTYAADEIENLFDNPGFEDGKAEEAKQVPGWNLYEQGGVGSFWVDYARCYEGEYVEGEIKPAGHAVLPSDKLTTQWGHLKLI